MLPKKSEVFSKFKTFKVLVENQNGHKIKCLQNDNVGDFHFCVDNGIHRIRVLQLNPQENGAIERLDKNILDRA